MPRYFPHPDRPALAAFAASLAVLFAPALALGAASVEYHSPLLFVGAIAEMLVAWLVVRTPQIWKPPASGLTILLYAMGLGWLWVVTADDAAVGLRILRGAMILVAVGLFAIQDAARNGVEPRRRAKKLTQRLLQRVRWPGSVEDYPLIPDVRRLHAAVRGDPTLAFVLVEDRRPTVQTAGLMALQDRAYWRWDEASVVLKAARSSASAEVRALALSALRGAEGAEFLRSATPFLKDPSELVRAAAAEVLLAHGDRRWGQVRGAVREAMADPNLTADGPLPGAAGIWPAAALCDLSGWAAEPAPLAERAVRSLLGHYELVLHSGTDLRLPGELAKQVTEDTTPPVLRIELAHLLRRTGRMPLDRLDRLTDADQPGPIRLLAAELLLEANGVDLTAMDVLRGLGRQSNRDTALAIARILQTHAGMDFALPPPGVTPTPKQVTETAQRVLKWATGRATENALDHTPSPFERPESVYGPSSNPGVRTPERWRAPR